METPRETDIGTTCIYIQVETPCRNSSTHSECMHAGNVDLHLSLCVRTTQRISRTHRFRSAFAKVKLGMQIDERKCISEVTRIASRISKQSQSVSSIRESGCGKRHRQKTPQEAEPSLFASRSHSKMIRKSISVSLAAAHLNPKPTHSKSR